MAVGLQLAVSQDKAVGGGLGRPSSPRRRAYERRKANATEQMKTLFRDEELERALDDMYQRPLLETSSDLLNRLMRSGVNDEELAEAIIDAPPGIFDPRSWAYWNLKIGRYPAPPMPRRTFGE